MLPSSTPENLPPQVHSELRIKETGGMKASIYPQSMSRSVLLGRLGWTCDLIGGMIFAFMILGVEVHLHCVIMLCLFFPQGS